MGDRGPDSKYTDEERALQGNPGNRVPPEEASDADVPPLPSPLDYVPEPPAFLAGAGSDMSAMAVSTWRALAPLLVDARALRESDLFSLGRYCRYVAEWVQLTSDIDSYGFTVTNETKHGMTHAPNPAVMARQRVEQAMQALERELGLAPQSRMKVQKTLMAALKDLPLAGRKATANGGGAIGFLNEEDDDEEE